LVKVLKIKTIFLNIKKILIPKKSLIFL